MNKVLVIKVLKDIYFLKFISLSSFTYNYIIKI